MQIAGDQSRHVLPLTSRYPAVRRSRTPDHRRNATARSASPSRICHPAGSGRAAGHWTGCRITWRPACPALSWSVTRGPNRPSGSRRQIERGCHVVILVPLPGSCDSRPSPNGCRSWWTRFLAATWREPPEQSRRPRGNRPVRPGGSSSVITPPHSGCGDTQRPAGTFPAQALTSRRVGGRTRCTMNQARRGQAAGRSRAGRPTPGRAPDLARIRRVRHDERVAAADVAKDSGMVCIRTRPVPAPGAAPCGRPGPRRARSARWAVSSRATGSRW